MKRVILAILAVVAIFIVVCGIGYLWLGYYFTKSLEPKIDPSLYTDIVLERVEYSEQYSFLPTVIPQEAIKVAFLHIPGFLQGSDVIMLRITLPKKKIQEMIAELEKSNRKEIKSFEGIPIPKALPEYGMKNPNSKNLFEGVSELPADFRIFLFKSDLENIQKNWNHNILSFTSVSEKRNEVLYYIDNW